MKEKKRRIAIFMMVNPNETDAPSGATEIDGPARFPGSDETYQVFVNGSEKEFNETSPNPMLDAACHEFGHILSGIFKLPGGMTQDPRSLCEFKDACCVGCEATKEQAQRIYTNEKLAWELAKKMRPVDPVSANKALASYQKLVNLAETEEQREMSADHKNHIAEQKRKTKALIASLEDVLGQIDKRLAEIEEEEKKEPVAA